MAVVLLASFLATLSSCGDQQRENDPTSSDEFPVDRIAPCDPDRDRGEPFDHRFTLQRVDWVEVIDEHVMSMTVGKEPVEGTVALTLMVADVGENLEQRKSSPRTLLVHRDFLSAIEWVPDSTSRLFLGAEPVDAQYAGAEYEGIPLVWYVMVREKSGSHRFAGRCAQQAVETPLRETLGARYEQVLEQLLIGGSEIAEPLLFPSEAGQPDSVPEMLDSERTYDKLTLVNITISWPKEWAASGWTICTRILRGWNDSCASLAMAEGEALVSGFVEVGQPLEVWILDGNGDLSAPIGLVGSTKPIDSTAAAAGSISISVSGVLSLDERAITEAVVDE